MMFYDWVEAIDYQQVGGRGFFLIALSP